MYAIEFETDIKTEYIRIPEYEKIKNQHVKVIVLAEGVGDASEKLSVSRQPAKVPPIDFKGDVIETTPASDWNLT